MHSLLDVVVENMADDDSCWLACTASAMQCELNKARVAMLPELRYSDLLAYV